MLLSLRCHRPVRRVALVAVLGACAHHARADGAATVDAAGQIRARSVALAAAEGRKDVAAVLPYFTEDVVVHAAGAPPITGRDGVRRFYDEAFKAPIVTFTGTVTTVTVARAGDLAYETGVNRFVIATPEARSRTSASTSRCGRRPGASGGSRC